MGQRNKRLSKKVIGIVFDNSSSMIWADDNSKEHIESWCRATYAIEVFASMLNEGDELYIYPMNEFEVEENGKKNSYNMKKPLKVEGGSDTSFLETIKTKDVEHAITPLSSINNVIMQETISRRGRHLQMSSGSSF